MHGIYPFYRGRYSTYNKKAIYLTYFPYVQRYDLKSTGRGCSTFIPTMTLYTSLDQTDTRHLENTKLRQQASRARNNQQQGRECNAIIPIRLR